MMTAEQLDAVLRVARLHRAAQLVMEGDKLTVVFEPDVDPLASGGPGGWKSWEGANLDANPDADPDAQPEARSAE